MNKELQAQIEATQDLELLGAFCWWSLRNVSVGYSYLEEQFVVNGLPPEWLIAKPTPETAFTKALVKNSRKNKGDETSYIFRPILKSNKRIVYGIIKEGVNKDLEELSYEQMDKIELNCENGSLTLPINPDLAELSDQFNTDFNEMLYNCDSYDLSKQIRLVLNKLSCLHVRDRGGVYFVLHENEAQLLALEKLVAICKAGDFYILPQVNLKKTIQSISKVFLDNVTEDLKAFKDQALTWETSKTKINTVDNTLVELNQFKNKLNTYSRVLKLDVSDTAKPVNEIEGKIHAFYARKLKVK